MNTLISILISGIAVMISAFFLEGVAIRNFGSALWTAVMIAIANAIIKPVLVFLTIPLTLITFGLFLFVINALIILLATKLSPGFKVRNFWWAMAFSIMLSIVNTVLMWFV
jgi:putative membrane protein